MDIYYTKHTKNFQTPEFLKTFFLHSLPSLLSSGNSIRERTVLERTDFPTTITTSSTPFISSLSFSLLGHNTVSYCSQILTLNRQLVSRFRREQKKEPNSRQIHSLFLYIALALYSDMTFSATYSPLGPCTTASYVRTVV